MDPLGVSPASPSSSGHRRPTSMEGLLFLCFPPESGQWEAAARAGRKGRGRELRSGCSSSSSLPAGNPLGWWHFCLRSGCHSCWMALSIMPPGCGVAPANCCSLTLYVPLLARYSNCPLLVSLSLPHLCKLPLYCPLSNPPV